MSPCMQVAHPIDVLGDHRPVDAQLVVQLADAAPSGVARFPRIVRPGSPGSCWPTKKMIMDRIQRVIRASPMRLRM